MDQSKRLKVIYSPNALADLSEIWSWNLSHNGKSQADLYRAFIKRKIRELTETYHLCRKVKGRGDLYYSNIHWSTQGHGHVVVFSISQTSGSLIVARIYHSSQNWKSHYESDAED